MERDILSLSQNKKVNFDKTETIKKKKNSIKDSDLNPMHKSSTTMDLFGLNSLNFSRIKSTGNLIPLSNELNKKNSINDFELLSNLGRGSYAKVLLARNKFNGKLYAIKIINKNFLEKLNKEHEVHIEKYVLTKLNHPNIIKLNKTFQDKRHLYFVLEFCQNKDLSSLIKLIGNLDYKLIKYYSAEILSGLTYMHKNGIYHRDLKPENIGITDDMHLKIFDFGTAFIKGKYFDKKKMKFIELDDDLIENKLKEKNYEEEEIEIDNYIIKILKNEFVGTAEYVSPEVLNHKYNEISPAMDLWAFGCIIYLLFEGKSPFKGKNEKEIFNNINNLNYKFNEKFPEDAKDLIQKLLVLNPKDRIGFGNEKNNYNDIKEHPFFQDINFDNLDIINPPIEKIEIYLRNNGFFKEKIEEKNLNLSDNLKNNNFNFNNISDYNSEISDDNNKMKKIKSMNKLYLVNVLNKKKNEEEKIIINNESENNENDENKVLLEDMLKKKSPWFHYNLRYVKLYGKGLIEYYDSDKKTLKGSILINEFCKVKIIDDYKFELYTEKRKFVFKHTINKIAHIWARKINSIILRKLKKNKNDC